MRGLCTRTTGITMKKNILIMSIVALYLFLTPAPLLAQNTVSASPAAQIEYAFPYPGLLPDHPLYVFKAMRDRVVSFFIKDSMKKASFDLLQSDKRVEASVMLAQKDKKHASLVVSTFSKADNYFEEAIRNIAKAKAEKKDVASLKGQVQTAAKKYKEVLQGLAGKLSTEKQAYKILLDRADTLIEQASKL